MHVDSKFNAIFDTDMNVKAVPRYADDIDHANAYQKFIEWGFASADAKTKFYEAAKEAIMI
jgi:hypothetical protein